MSDDLRTEIKSYLDMEKPRKRAILKIQSQIIQSLRKFLEMEKLKEILVPIIEPFTDEGIGRAIPFKVDYYGKECSVMSALTVHKSILASKLGSIFAFCSCARKEEVVEGDKRHLSQFHQLEVEICYGTHKKAMELLERMVQFVIQKVKEKCSEELKTLGRKIKVPEIPFKRITHKEAVDLARKLGFEVGYDEDISSEVEKAISMKFSEPFFIEKFSSKLSKFRGFTYKVDGEVILDFDLIYPQGFEEGSSGSEREEDYEKLKAKLKEFGMTERFKIFLEVAKRGLKQSSGFGFGIERFTKYICGLDDIREATLFPKVPGG